MKPTAPPHAQPTAAQQSHTASTTGALIKKSLAAGSKYSKVETLRLKSIFEEHDRNHDGKVTVLELVAALENDPFLARRQVDAFRAIDVNKDGFLTLDEYLRCCHPAATDKELAIMLRWAKPAPKPAVVERTFEPTPRQLEEIKAMFNMYDKNHDGFLSLPELCAVAEKCGYQSKEFQDLWDTTDKNKDGKIQFEEFVQLMSCSYI